MKEAYKKREGMAEGKRLAGLLVPCLLFELCSCKDDFSNIEAIANNMGWIKQLEKDKKKKKDPPGAMPEVDLTGKPQYSGKRLTLGLLI